MKMPRIRTYILQARLALSRLGWHVVLIGGLLAAGAAGWFWLIPSLQGQVAERQRTLAEVRRPAQAAADAGATKPSVDEARLADFYGVLGEKRYVEQQVKSLFEIAKQTGLLLQQAEYRMGIDSGGRVSTYQITLPVKGSYLAIRQFCERTLLAIPFASLDEINFKRESISANVLEAGLRFTLYLGDERVPASAPEVASAGGSS